MSNTSDRSNSDITDRLGFMQLDNDARKALREISPLIGEALPGVLKRFYEHLSRWPQVSKFFPNSSVIDHAARKQAEHWATILRGEFGADYVASVRKIGQTHARIGLEPRWYIGGYNFIVGHCNALIAAHCARKHGKNPKVMQVEVERLCSAFFRAAMLDMDLAIAVYLEESELAKQKAVLEVAKTFESSVAGVVDGVASAATELEHTARAMSQIAESTSGKAVAVSAAAEQATSNVSSVANSAEEMGRSVTEIAGQVNHASRIASNAVVKARATNETMSSLAAASEKIGEVVSLISDIAAQTNLLALNATIESARAGEAGRGFAVVASEVKNLAGQTARATDEISAQIASMQAITRQSVEAIQAIQTTINEIDTVSAAINAAVEEQTATTREIARNTQQAAVGTQEVTSNIGAVQRGASETGDAASQVVKASSELGRQAETLRGQVSRFLTNIRAA